jgi:hypothetical protein
MPSRKEELEHDLLLAQVRHVRFCQYTLSRPAQRIDRRLNRPS